MHVATDMVPNTPRRGMRGWAVRSLCITQIKSYHPNEPLRRKVPEMNTFPQFHAESLRNLQIGGSTSSDPLSSTRRSVRLSGIAWQAAKDFIATSIFLLR